MNFDSRPGRDSSQKPKRSGGRNMPSGSETTNDEGTAVDFSILAMLKKLGPDSEGMTFSEQIREFTERICDNLHLLESFVHTGNLSKLEEEAYKLSQNSLRVGAVGIMKLSYELQSASKCGNVSYAGRLILSIKEELQQVKLGLSQAI